MFDRERMRRVYKVILFNKILRNHLLSESMQWNCAIIQCYLMHDFMEYILGDIFFGTTTTESKNIVKLLAISQTIHTVYCEDNNYFPKGKFKLLKLRFVSLSVACFANKFVFANLFAVRYDCGLYVTKIIYKCWLLWHGMRLPQVVLLVLFTFAHIVCLMATLNQNKQTRLLYFGYNIKWCKSVIKRMWKCLDNSILN